MRKISNIAWYELHEFLDSDEILERICFGGFKNGGFEDGHWSFDEDEPEPKVPIELRGIPLKPETARPYMITWSFDDRDFNYAIIAWTNKRTIFTVEYDNTVTLGGVPRHPIQTIPEYL